MPEWSRAPSVREEWSGWGRRVGHRSLTDETVNVGVVDLQHQVVDTGPMAHFEANACQKESGQWLHHHQVDTDLAVVSARARPLPSCRRSATDPCRRSNCAETP